jgi:hypothetical protein
VASGSGGGGRVGGPRGQRGMDFGVGVGPGGARAGPTMGTTVAASWPYCGDQVAPVDDDGWAGRCRGQVPFGRWARRKAEQRRSGTGVDGGGRLIGDLVWARAK